MTLERSTAPIARTVLKPTTLRGTFFQAASTGAEG
jgi:hypothetical protein